MAYSLGLGLPFLLIAGGYSSGPGARRAGCAGTTARSRSVGGVLLLAVGLLLVTGVWDTLTAQLQSRLVSGFETVI